MAKRPNDDELLQLYGLYKQATVGDNTTDKPGVFDFKGKYKWEAWKKLEGTSQEEAEKKYIALRLCGGESVRRALEEHVDQTAQRGERRVEAVQQHVRVQFRREALVLPVVGHSDHKQGQLENELKPDKILEPQRRLSAQEVFVLGYVEVAQLLLDVELPGTRDGQRGIHQHGDRNVE
ncbi:hypothetical protein KL942_002091 [Ogataea angusta]|uniref:ACB domain-containing protein n=1 Tax=Pichia angusta TaxID=870730 RepID=A0ABQ7RRB4_PICAN|nr:hypothetical protein KL943_000763 [Ogataea angusta]KAG7841103.1 hypothetical protein KL942_002091 [Ogataea angusta]KAG7846125.1 hypothetical protein KL940_004712 [Ogataea angusta]KAG7860987.1 hypothetical protein KL939_001554 [Ogataea angusta]